MRVGTRVADRWQVVAEAAGEPTVARWRVVDVHTGEPGELLVLRPASAYDRASHRAFLKRHRALAEVKEPAVTRTLHSGWDGTNAFVVREPVEEATAADLPVRMAPEVVAAIGARLVPALMAGGQATGSAVTDLDIGLDSRGRPVFAPRGRPAVSVDRSDQRWVAPEAFLGTPPDAAGGLYGLGVVLYRLLTGRDPLPEGADPATATPPLPSTTRADIPEKLERAILILLSTDPNMRAGALPLLQETAGALPDLRPEATQKPRPRPPTLQTGEVVLSTPAVASNASRGRVDDPDPKGHIIVPASDLGRLDAVKRNAAAGWAGVPVRAVDDLARAGLPLVLEVHDSQARAAERLVVLRAESGLPLVVTGPSGWLAPVVAFVQIFAALVLLAVGLVTALFPLIVVSVLLAMSTGFVIQRTSRNRPKLASVRASRELLKHRAVGSPAIAMMQERVCELRRRTHAADLPENAAADVRSALSEVERRLGDLTKVDSAVSDTLSAVNIGQLRRRLASLSEQARNDARAEPQRDRAARTLADLEAVGSRQSVIEQELTSVDEALDELAGVLGQLATQTSSADALSKLKQTTRLTREALQDVEAPVKRGGQDVKT